MKSIAAIIVLVLLLTSTCLYAVTLDITQGDFKGWQATGYREISEKSGTIDGVIGDWPFLTSPQLNIDTSKIKRMIVTMTSDTTGLGLVYFRRTGEGLAEARLCRFNIEGDGRRHSYSVDLTQTPYWTGTVEQVRLDLLYVPGAKVQIFSMRFAEPSTNGLVKNGDFSISSDGKTPDDWTVSARNGSSSIITGPGKPAVIMSANSGGRVILASNLLINDLGKYKLTCSYRASEIKPGDHLKLLISYSDIFRNKTAGSLEYDLTTGKPGTQQFEKIIDIPKLAARAQISVQLESASGKSTARLESIDLKMVDPYKWNSAAKVDRHRSHYWTAQWIWKPADASDDSTAVCQFRKEFEVPDKDFIKQAFAEVTGDNYCTVYINGKKLPQGPFFSVWTEPDLYDLKPYLVSGKNVVGIEIENSGGQAGALGEVNILLKNGKSISLKTDPTWKCGRSQSGNWSSVAFDDSGWVASLSYGVPPNGVWSNRMSYVYTGVMNPVQVLSLSAPKNIKPDQWLTYSLTLKPGQKVAKDTELVVELNSSGASKAKLLGTQALPIIPAGQKTTISGRIRLSKYIQPGSYKLSFTTDSFDMLPAKNSNAAKQMFSVVSSLNIKKDLQISSIPTAKLSTINGTPVFIVNGKPLTTFNTEVYLYKEEAKVLHANIGRAGVDTYLLSFDFIPYLGKGKFDWALMDTAIMDILDANPKAYIVLFLAVDGSRNPGLANYDKEHPDEYCRTESGSIDIPAYQGNGTQRVPSLASDGWQKRTCYLLKEVVKHVGKSSYGSRVIGYAPCSGITWEWQMWGSTLSPSPMVYVDYSEPARAAFERFVQKKYTTISSLNQAWKMNLTSFDEVRIPSSQQRNKADFFTFINPGNGRYESDYRRYYSEALSMAISRFGSAIKEESKGKALVGTYYGYVTFVTGAGRYQVTGHNGVNVFTHSPYLDFGIGPSWYSGRAMGEGSGFMTAAESFKVNGKLWIDQVDHRTHHMQDGFTPSQDINDDAAVLMRHYAKCLVAGASAQVMDFGTGSTLGDPRLLQMIKKYSEIERSMLRVKRKPEDPARSIAVIMDERAGDYTKLLSNIHYDLVSRQLAEMCKTGAGFDVYLIDDMERIPDGYKCYLFLNTFSIDNNQKAYIDSRFKKNGNTLVFLYAPGIIDGSKIDTSRVSEITGINMDVRNVEKKQSVTVLRNSNTVSSLLPSEKVTYSDIEPYGPVFVPIEGEVIGTTQDSTPGLVIKKQPGWTSIYSASPALPASLIRGIATNAGVIIPNPHEGDVTYVGDKLICIHTIEGGTRTLSLPNLIGQITELFTGRKYPVKNGKAIVTIPERWTALYLQQ